MQLWTAKHGATLVVILSVYFVRTFNYCFKHENVGSGKPNLKWFYLFEFFCNMYYYGQRKILTEEGAGPTLIYRVWDTGLTSGHVILGPRIL